MPFDARALTRNKPLLIGVAGAAALGAVMYLRRGGPNAGAGTTAAGGIQTASVPAFSSTGTDLRAAIGDLGAGLQQQIGDYVTQLQTSAGAGAIPTGPPFRGQPIPWPGPANSITITARGGMSVADFIAKYGVSLSTIQALNKGVLISPGHHAGAAKLTDQLKPGTAIRIR